MFNKNFNFELRSNVISGPNTIKNVYKFLKEKNFKKVGLVLDKNLYKNSKYIKNFSKEFKKKVSASKKFAESPILLGDHAVFKFGAIHQ